MRSYARTMFRPFRAMLASVLVALSYAPAVLYAQQVSFDGLRAEPTSIASVVPVASFISSEIVLDALDRKPTAPVVTALAASADGRFLAAAGDDHAIRIIDVASGTTTQILRAHTDWIRALVFASDDQTLYSAGDDGRILRWDHMYPIQSEEVTRLDYAVRSLSVSTEQQLLAIGGFCDTILIWDLSQNEIRHALACDCGDQRCVRFSPQGNHVLCGGRSGTLSVWDVKSGETIAVFHEHQRRVQTAAFSADGTKVTSVGEDRRLIQYDLTTQEITLNRELVGTKLMSMCMINDDLVAIAGADNSVHLYDALADQVVADLPGHFGTVAAMTPCGDMLASGSFDTTIRIWNLENIERDGVDYGKPVYAPLKVDSNLRIR